MPHVIDFKINVKPKLSIIIITKDTKDLLQRLLGSFLNERTIKGVTFETIVVDNGSTDGTVEMLNHLFSGITLVKNEKNLGFAASANRGFSVSSGEYILFLNSDTVVLPGEIEKMIDFMEDDKKTGICGPQLLYEDLRPQRSFANAPKLLFEFIPKSLLEFLLPHKYKSKRSVFETPQDVESLIGAAFMVKRKVFEQLGGFDERFFFFLEETDLCIRARKNGFRVVFIPHARIIHLQGKTVSKSWIKGRIEYNISLYKFIRKHRSLTYFFIFVCIRFIKSLFLIILLTSLPVLLLHRQIRRSYIYYLSLFTWHLKGCQDNEGLKA